MPRRSRRVRKPNGALADLHGSPPPYPARWSSRPSATACSIQTGGLNSGAGTRRIEYGAEVVLDLDREANAGVARLNELPMTVTVRKNRHGTPGAKVELMFHGALQSFREP